MLTLFATPKPNRGLMALLQRNAVQSWLSLRPACEIVLFGDDEGTADLARELGLRHEPCLQRNELGTPLVGPLFAAAERLASHERLAYVNADIILLDDFPAALGAVSLPRFLMTGRRCDLEVHAPIDFQAAGWQARLVTEARTRGRWYDHTGMDYFVFERGAFGEIPSFALGRTVWDNWLIYRMRAQGIPVVDATAVVTPIHQRHDYAHARGGKVGAFWGVEHRSNLRLAGGELHLFDLKDADWSLTPTGLQRRGPGAELRHRLIRAAEQAPLTTPVVWLAVRVLRLFFHLEDWLRRKRCPPVDQSQS